MQKRADGARLPNETRQVAFSKYATGTHEGRAFMAAHKAAEGEDWSGEEMMQPVSPKPHTMP
jgi:hypothetical protein